MRAVFGAGLDVEAIIDRGTQAVGVEMPKGRNSGLEGIAGLRESILDGKS